MGSLDQSDPSPAATKWRPHPAHDLVLQYHAITNLHKGP